MPSICLTVGAVDEAISPCLLHCRARACKIQSKPTAGGPSVDSLQAKKTKGLAAATLLTLVIYGAAGRNRTHDPLVRSFACLRKSLTDNGVQPSVPTHAALRVSVVHSPVPQGF